MAKSESVREYKMADGEMSQKADTLVLSVKRDLTQFETRNVDDGRIGELVTLSADF